MRRKAQNGVAQSRTLAGIRDALLPRLLSGELRVPDAARFVETEVWLTERAEAKEKR